jgi:hypothetical protein
MKRLAFSLIVLFLSGCTTVEFVRKDQVPQKQGVLRYLPTSSASKEAKYREKVNEKAREFCGGEFKITKEYQAREETGSSTGIGTGIGFGHAGIMLGGSRGSTAMYQFVEFVCGS